MTKTKVDLFTGFLGAGKTTFLTRYIEYLKDKNEKTVIIENEFGKAGVDTQILNKESADIHELSGGCICCGLKVGFHNMLIDLSKKYNHILVEPTGIYTVEDFLDIMFSPSVTPYCEIGNIITVVDPHAIPDNDESTEKIFYSQIAYSGLIILSKSSYSQSLYKEVTGKIRDIVIKYNCPETTHTPEILLKDWDELSDDDFEEIGKSGYSTVLSGVEKENHSNLFLNITIKPEFKSRTLMLNFLKKCMNGQFGQLIRVKGYCICENSMYELNCTRNNLNYECVEGNYNKGINLIGKYIDRKKIKEFLLNN